MLEFIKTEANRTYTENGALSHATTNSDCLDLFATIGALRSAKEQEIILGIRPEHLKITSEGIPAELGVREMMGSSVHVHLTAMDREAVAVVSGMDDTGHFLSNVPQTGQVNLSFHGNAVHLFDPVTQRNLEFAEKMMENSADIEG